MTYCEELVPILHGVKLTKCEIYGSPDVRQTPSSTGLRTNQFSKRLLMNQKVQKTREYITTCTMVKYVSAGAGGEDGEGESFNR